MFSWVLLSFDGYHVNLLIFGENVLHFRLEFQHHCSCFLFSPFYLWGQNVKTIFPRLACHWESLGGELEYHRKTEATTALAVVSRTVGLSGCQRQGGATALGGSPVGTSLWCCRQMDHQWRFLSTTFFFFFAFLKTRRYPLS